MRASRSPLIIGALGLASVLAGYSGADGPHRVSAGVPQDQQVIFGEETSRIQSCAGQADIP